MCNLLYAAIYTFIWRSMMLYYKLQFSQGIEQVAWPLVYMRTVCTLISSNKYHSESNLFSSMRANRLADWTFPPFTIIIQELSSEDWVRNVNTMSAWQKWGSEDDKDSKRLGGRWEEGQVRELINHTVTTEGLSRSSRHKCVYNVNKNMGGMTFRVVFLVMININQHGCYLQHSKCSMQK